MARKRLSWLGGVCAAALGVCQAEAQTASPPASVGTTLGEVIVTAQRTEQNLEKVPTSVAVYNQQQLNQRQITDMPTLVSATPNMSMAPGYDPTDVEIGIRGISETLPELGVDPAVGVYIDEVYSASNQGTNTGFVDMERVEVLRGPQGTLFGRNTIGGALNITTARPTDRFEGYVEGELGNADHAEFTGVINVPLASGIAGRLAYQHYQQNGFESSSFLNKRLGDVDSDFLRGTLRFDLPSNWQVVLIGSYYHFTSGSTANKVVYVDPGPDALFPTLLGFPGQLMSQAEGDGPYVNTADVAPSGHGHVYTGTAIVTGKLGESVNFKSVTGYRDQGSDRGTDIDGMFYQLLDLLHYPVEEREVSQEVQFSGKALDGRLDWIGGLYYYHSNSSELGQVNVLIPLLATTSIGIDSTDSSTSESAYAQVTFRILDKLRLTGGVRYTHDSKSVSYFDYTADLNTLNFQSCSLPVANPLVQSQCQLSGKVSFQYVPWTVGLEYDLTDQLMLYAKASDGVRSGGWAQSGPRPGETMADASFDPEKVLSPEIGAKYESPGQRLRLNVALYEMTYSAIQQSSSIVTVDGEQSITANVGGAQLWGAEVDASALLGPLRVDASGAFNDAKFTVGPELGLPVVNNSKYSYSLNATWPINTEIGVLSLNADWNWRSSIYYYEPTPGNPGASASVRQPAYGLFNGQVTLALHAIPMTLSLWAKNLADQYYAARLTYTAGFGITDAILGDRRTFGGTVRYRF